ncbi:uncharacterized protein LOC125471117 isoform X2 [Pyrus x bretschneideri]|uniref:uncharacterized protein LOC125471117 isoform X2 n=1 Tax=Pyrus x bretschneideri TaxID=225117 RepID=UPI00202ED04C|nr:uncharacterized protein LOC125471117 isoform X2 [Pyrus x bretschneideri]
MDNLLSWSLSDFIVWDYFWKLGAARGSSSGYSNVWRLTFRLKILSKTNCSHEFSAREVREGPFLQKWNKIFVLEDGDNS